MNIVVDNGIATHPQLSPLACTLWRLQGHGHGPSLLGLGLGDLLVSVGVVDLQQGEPARSLSERRNKTSALRDVGSILRSFHYASFAAAFNRSGSVIPVKRADLEPWGRYWYA